MLTERASHTGPLLPPTGRLASSSSARAGGSHGGAIVGLAACSVMMTIAATAADLMQDFKTGYMTLASPRSMFISQVIGTAMGCIIGPCVFWLFYKVFGGVGLSSSDYPTPYAIVYRNMAVLGVNGFSSLPKHCLTPVLHNVRRGGRRQPRERLGAEGGVKVHTCTHGDGDTVLPWIVLCNCVGSAILFA